MQVGEMMFAVMLLFCNIANTYGLHCKYVEIYVYDNSGWVKLLQDYLYNYN